MDPFIPPSGGYQNLLSSQEPNPSFSFASDQIPSFTFSASYASGFGSQWTEEGNEDVETVTDRNQRRKSTPIEDGVLISAWLNTSKDPIVGNEQKALAFSKRVANYFAASPKLAGAQKREPMHCKQRWGKINDGCVNLLAVMKPQPSRDRVDMFRRRFRMNKSLFISIIDRLSAEITYFQQRRDATGRFGHSPLQKATAAIRLMAYGCAADAVDEYLRIGETTALLCLDHFVEGIINLFGDQYLRRLTPEDLQRLLDIGEIRGFPGMIGSIDCMHWEWKNCPTAWKGQYTRGAGKPTIILEAVASQDLWIWHAFFGSPDTLNDINVLDRSPVFDDILQGRAPRVNYIVNGHEYNLAYYLTDGIYPNWATFVQSIKLPQGPKASLFATHQEGARKDVERAFGVLQARFAIVKRPALQWDKIKIGKIMRACIILHNMIVENERENYTQFDTSDFEDQRTSEVDSTYSTEMASNLGNMMSIRSRVRDKIIHQQLKADLVEHIWQKYGTNQHFN